MLTDSTVEVTAYENLADGEIFTAVRRNGSLFLGMKVATREDRSDLPNRDVLQLSSEQPPALFSGAFLDGRPVVAKMKNLVFVIHPQKPTDLLLDLQNDIRARAALGCAFLISDDIFLAVEMKNNRGEGIYFVNVKTGEGWHSPDLGSSKTNLLRDAVAVPRWQIVETTGDKIPWINYEVPNRQSVRAA